MFIKLIYRIKNKKRKNNRSFEKKNYDVDDLYKRSVKFFKGNKTILKSEQVLNRNQESK